jgi:uncharacterized membrane protein
LDPAYENNDEEYLIVNLLVKFYYNKNASGNKYMLNKEVVVYYVAISVTIFQ